MSEHIHTPGDGKGYRQTFVNGNEVRNVFYANEKKGIVKFYPRPLRVKKPEGDEAYSRTLRGHVTVEFVDSSKDKERG